MKRRHVGVQCRAAGAEKWEGQQGRGQWQAASRGGRVQFAS